MSQPKLSGSGSRLTPRHIWTPEQKRCLLVLLTQFQLSWDQTAVAFHNVFRTEINASDFPHGLLLKSLKSQYRESKQDDNVSWSCITRPESWEAESAWREELAQRIRRCLQMLADGQDGLEKSPSSAASS